MRIYVAGPYSHHLRSGRIANTHAAIDIGYALMLKGHIAFIPHLSHFIEEHAIITGQQDNIGYEFWLRQDIAWLDLCDALFFMAPSKGADMERERALKRGDRSVWQ